MKKWSKNDPVNNDWPAVDKIPTTWKINPKPFKSIYNEEKPNTYGLDENNELWLMTWTPKDEILKEDIFWKGEKVGVKCELVDTKGWRGVIVGGVAYVSSVSDYGAAITAADEELKWLLADAKEEFGA